eukprot:6992531-Pyramimonas_sp.AAC.1
MCLSPRRRAHSSVEVGRSSTDGGRAGVKMWLSPQRREPPLWNSTAGSRNLLADAPRTVFWH